MADAQEEMSALSIAKAAELLVWSRRQGTPLPALPSDLAPGSLERGYDIQLAAFGLRASSIAGYKVGLTSAEAQRAAGAITPIVGHLACGDILRSPARVAAGQHHLRIVEAEIVFEMGQELDAGDAPFTEGKLQQSIRAAFAGIEVCNSRLSNPDEAPLAAVVADNSNADLLVVGEPLIDFGYEALANLSVTLAHRRVPVVQGSTRRVLGHPLKSLTWLANWLSARGQGLRRGQLIATGSCTGFVEAAPDDRIIATFAETACASVEFYAAEPKETG